MMDAEIKCLRCNQVLTHVCDDSVTEVAKRLYAYVPEIPYKVVRAGFKAMTDDFYYSEGDEKNMPFFSETFLYNLIGKEDARTVLALVGNLLRAAGVDPYAVRKK